MNFSIARNYSKIYFWNEQNKQENDILKQKRGIETDLSRKWFWHRLVKSSTGLPREIQNSVIQNGYELNWFAW